MELLPSQRDQVAMGKQPEANGNFLGNHECNSALSCSPLSGAKKCPPTILLGFSKGGVVLNQLLAELTQFEDFMEEGKSSRKIKRQHHNSKWDNGKATNCKASGHAEKGSIDYGLVSASTQVTSACRVAACLGCSQLVFYVISTVSLDYH